jgi:periplasmic copper chaperone A
VKLNFLILTFSLLTLIGGGNLKVTDGWMRPGAKDMMTAGYFKIVNNENQPDTLYKATANFCKQAELHETYKNGDMMGMRATPLVVIQAKSTFEFKPGANHVMLMNLKKDIKVGSEEYITLYFKHHDAIKVLLKAKE